MIIEMKGKDVFKVRSYLSLMLAINSELAAPVSLTDRPSHHGHSPVMACYHKCFLP